MTLLDITNEKLFFLASSDTETMDSYKTSDTAAHHDSDTDVPDDRGGNAGNKADDGTSSAANNDDQSYVNRNIYDANVIEPSTSHDNVLNINREKATSDIINTINSYEDHRFPSQGSYIHIPTYLKVN